MIKYEIQIRASTAYKMNLLNINRALYLPYQYTTLYFIITCIRISFTIIYHYLDFKKKIDRASESVKRDHSRFLGMPTIYNKLKL